MLQGELRRFPECSRDKVSKGGIVPWYPSERWALFLALGIVVLVGSVPGCDAQPTPEAARRDMPPSSGVVVISMTDAMRFAPSHPTVSVGDTVVWVNDGALPHTTTDDPSQAAVPEHNVLPPGAQAWDSGVVTAGSTFTQVFATPGEYTYVCILHEAAGMLGRITVQ